MLKHQNNTISIKSSLFSSSFFAQMSVVVGVFRFPPLFHPFLCPSVDAHFPVVEKGPKSDSIAKTAKSKMAESYHLD